MRNGCICLLALFLLLAHAAPVHAAEVKNVQSTQVGSRVQFTYDLIGEEREAEVTVNLTVPGNERKTADLHLEGDVGKVKPGRGKVICWNVLQDFPRGLNSEIAWEITAGGQSFTDTATGMEFVFIKGGCYKMGDTFGDGEADEKPVHNLCVNDFHLGKYEVTVGQFKKFVNETGYRTDGEKETGGNNGCWAFDLDDKEKNWNWRDWASWKKPNKYQDNSDDHPVICVSWNDTKAFTDWLTRKSGKSYRLPTEAEWEYAARGGNATRNYWGNGKDDACGYANVADLSKLPNGSSWSVKHECTDGYTAVAPVGKFQPNGFGLYDMMGNVWEWCQDWYGEKYYSERSKENPRGPSSGQSRVLRGGSWLLDPAFVRAADRLRDGPANRDNIYGCRLSFSAP